MGNTIDQDLEKMSEIRKEQQIRTISDAEILTMR